MAIKREMTDMVQLLLTYGADANNKDQVVQTRHVYGVVIKSSAHRVKYTRVIM